MYKQVLDPVSHSLGLTAIFAVLPLVVLFVLLGGFRMKAQWASLIALGVSILIAITVYSMPIGQAGDAALEGAVFGFWPIMWIVINALWIFNMTDATGYFAVLRRTFSSVSDDPRVQVVVIAFCFGALLEALAGFGTPVAICGVMLVGLGFSPLRAASLALVADTAPVAFGAIAIPITTLAQVSGLPVHHLSMMVGRQTPFFALIVPFALVFMADGRRGVREAWPVALTAGVVFAILQFATSNYISTQLTDIVASLGSAAAVVIVVQIWSPHAPGAPATTVSRRPAIAGGAVADAALERRAIAEGGPAGPPPSRADIFKAFAPYLIIIVVLGVTSISGITKELDKATSAFSWPGLHVLLAAGAGGFFAFLSPMIGWFGTAVTGSDTSSNSLFGALQVAAAHKAHLSATLLAGANSSGGVLAKMISPQNLAIGAAAVGLAGKEGDIFRRVIGYSVVFVLLMGVLALLQSGALSFMVP